MLLPRKLRGKEKAKRPFSPMNRRSKKDAKRTFPPLTPALSPLRGEGERQPGWSQCARKMASELPMNRSNKRPSSPQPSPPPWEEREETGRFRDSRQESSIRKILTPALS